MNSVVLAVVAVVGYLVAYRTYGRYLSAKLFQIDPDRTTPAHELRDDTDFVPTRTEILFGHHYTSIAGTGPIVGPALGIIWGWVPAFLWVLFGPILIGGIHDFGSLVISARSQGRTIGENAGDLISPRVRLIFVTLLWFLLLIVLAIFGMVIASIFFLYPQSVIPIWAEIPIAMLLGHAIYKRGANPVPGSILAVIAMYATILVGARFPLELPAVHLAGITIEPLTTWVIVLMIYAYVASVLPVWRLLQPRDYINGHELYIVLGLLGLGVLVTHPPMVAPAFQAHPSGAPPLFPFLFITIACGAVSGFHSLVSSGTTSKQLDNEKDALPIAFGGMLLEGLLAVLVLLSVGAGIGYRATESGLLGRAAWDSFYQSWDSAGGLAATLQAFVRGSANLIEGIGISHGLALTIMGVFVASFAGTTLDTATRIQRYIVVEVAEKWHIKPLTTVHGATSFACGTALLLAMVQGAGKGGLILWPLFGAGNQLLAGLGLLVITVYLIRRGKPSFYTSVPMVFMLAITLWAMCLNLYSYATKGQWHLMAIGVVVIVLDVWMVIETVVTMKQIRQPGAERPAAPSPTVETPTE